MAGVTWQARQVGSRPASDRGEHRQHEGQGQHRPVHAARRRPCCFDCMRDQRQRAEARAAGRACRRPGRPPRSRSGTGGRSRLRERRARGGCRLRRRAPRTSPAAGRWCSPGTAPGSRRPARPTGLAVVADHLAVLQPLHHVVQLVRRVALQAAQLALLGGVVVEVLLQVGAVGRWTRSRTRTGSRCTRTRAGPASPARGAQLQLMLPLWPVSWRIAVENGIMNSSSLAEGAVAADQAVVARQRLPGFEHADDLELEAHHA